MKWIEPELTVVNMNAEIGGYQNDFDDDPRPYYGKPALVPRDGERDAEGVTNAGG
jgi:hypothetical protein